MLVVGNAEPLSSIAFQSIRSKYFGPILIGYVDKSDILFAEHDLLVERYDLRSSLKISNTSYVGIQDPDFFQVVLLKWELLLRALSLGYENVIYTDLDVLWLQDVVATVEETFKSFSSIEILIQSFTRGTELPCLCMGFLCLRTNLKTQEFIKLCQNTHIAMAKSNPMLGDDEVVSQVFQDMNYPGWIRELPQSTFPTGNLYPLYLRHLRFRKMARVYPYIIHLNFVVGLDNKLLLLKYLKLASYLELGFTKPPHLFEIGKRKIKQKLFRKLNS